VGERESEESGERRMGEGDLEGNGEDSSSDELSLNSKVRRTPARDTEVGDLIVRDDLFAMDTRSSNSPAVMSLSNRSSFFSLD